MSTLRFVYGTTAQGVPITDLNNTFQDATVADADGSIVYSRYDDSSGVQLVKKVVTSTSTGTVSRYIAHGLWSNKDSLTYNPINN